MSQQTKERYVLPALPYDEGALEPVISGQIMSLHYHKHHATYVNKLNEALRCLIQYRAPGRYFLTSFVAISAMYPSLYRAPAISCSRSATASRHCRQWLRHHTGNTR